MANFIRPSSIPKSCDVCQCSTAVVFCRADAAYLCSSCDAKVHGANKLALRHERVWMCEVCELSPAVVTCKADAAALCVQCDTDIHSANPLAQRHERVPITPFYEFPSMIKGAHVHGQSMGREAGSQDFRSNLLQEVEDPSSVAEATSWLLHRRHRDLSQQQENSGIAVVPSSPYTTLTTSHGHGSFGMQRHCSYPKIEPTSTDLYSEVDPYLDLEYGQAVSGPSIVTDSIVPEPGCRQSPSSHASGSVESQMPVRMYQYQNVNAASEGRVGPETSDTPVPHSGVACNGAQFEYPHRMIHVGQIQPMAREARVMRYREKRKNRKFEKTIRYASRKAYAESRPRIKGRFAKKKGDAEDETWNV